jgi:hypothetical protein
VGVSIAAGGPNRVEGQIEAPRAPGLGITPRLEVLGEPVVAIGQ